jgi:hypothetical protein
METSSVTTQTRAVLQAGRTGRSGPALRPHWSESALASASGSMILDTPNLNFESEQTRTRKSPIPVPPIPDSAGDRSGIGKSPVSRFGRESARGIGVPIGRKSGREPPIPDFAGKPVGNPRFPTQIRPGTGNRGPDSAGRGFPGLRLNPSHSDRYTRMWPSDSAALCGWPNANGQSACRVPLRRVHAHVMANRGSGANLTRAVH